MWWGAELASFLGLADGYSILWTDCICTPIHPWMDPWVPSAANKAAVKDEVPLWLFGSLCHLVAVASEGLLDVV